MTQSQVTLRFSHIYAGSSLCSHLLLPATSFFKLEVFPLISLVRQLCKWVSLRKTHFPALSNLRALQLHSFVCYSPCHIPCTAQAFLPRCFLLRGHCYRLSLLFCRLSMTLLQGWLARGNLPYVHSHPSEAVGLGDPNSACVEFQ